MYYNGTPYTDKNGKVIENVFKNEERVMMKNGIMVAPKLYKIIKCNTKSGSYTSGFTFLNSETYDNKKSLSSFETSLDEIESQTGMEFKLRTETPLTNYDQEGVDRTK